MIVIPNANTFTACNSPSLLWAGRQERQRLQKQALHNSLSRLVWFGAEEGGGRRGHLQMVVLTEEQSLKMVVQCLIGFGEKGRENEGERKRDFPIFLRLGRENTVQWSVNHKYHSYLIECFFTQLINILIIIF